MIVSNVEPKIVKDVLILKWGVSGENGVRHEKEETEMPYDAVYLTRSFQQLEVSGKAQNFRKTDEGILCDLVIEDGYFKSMLNHEFDVTAAPKLEGEFDDGRLKDAQLESVSLIINHAQTELNGNVSKAAE